MSLCWYFRKFIVSVATPPDGNMHICAGSSVYAAQTTRRYCYLQTVCFFDVSLKNICASSSWCKLGPTTYKIF
ncbi:hypothetical protein HanXRQr2_Chr13g0572751 [Helianthus annuus]|uniref:Uncharacterized protein n=1 Tax=Helianthus annuus TaxID=4232 RepID=A0A9K3EGY0_HELAN|nr:hypothetical protein HanXRQr2_Chr13g0572751 [Helianthus annuus]KAJ0496565.1 hypothetical protein HanHA89_Chr13g0501221 [Helianthus annuus]